MHSLKQIHAFLNHNFYPYNYWHSIFVLFAKSALLSFFIVVPFHFNTPFLVLNRIQKMAINIENTKSIICMYKQAFFLPPSKMVSFTNKKHGNFSFCFVQLKKAFSKET